LWPTIQGKIEASKPATDSKGASTVADSKYQQDSASQVWFIDKGEGPDLLLLHGNGADAKLYLPLIDLLAKEYRVLAPDLPGFGLSPSHEHWHLPSYIAQIEIFLNRHFRKPFMLIGHSMGGFLAYQLMLRNRTQAITRAIWMEAAIFQLDWKVAAALGPFGMLHRYKKHSRAGVQARLREWCWHYDESDPVFREAFIASYFRSNRQVQGMMMSSAPSLMPYRFDKLAQPVLCIRGEKEHMISRQTDWFAPQLPQGKRLVVPQAGHFLLGDNDAFLHSEIFHFLHAEKALTQN
jgi:pimeloyl-ACP methyl ester carboxylesterase